MVRAHTHTHTHTRTYTHARSTLGDPLYTRCTNIGELSFFLQPSSIFIIYHSFIRFFNKVPCTINSDDPLLFGSSLSEEYLLCRTELGLDDMVSVILISLTVLGLDGMVSVILISLTVLGLDDMASVILVSLTVQ